MRRSLSVSAALLFLVTPAWAAGKAGLWTISTVWQFRPAVVPSVWVALARQQGLSPPRNGQPFTHHICMSRYEAEGREPLHFNSRDYDCVNSVKNASRGQTVMEAICHGQVEGVGHYRINWRGDDHFEGSYDFTGKFRGDPARISSTFSADWAGSDCRGVRMFIPQQP